MQLADLAGGDRTAARLHQARLDAGQVCTNNNSNGTGGVTFTTVNTSLGSSVAAALFGVGSVIVQPVHLGPSFQF